MVDLAILYEHPQWFAPLFAALDERGVDHVAIPLGDHWFDLAAPPPARLIFSRVAQSAFLREPDHPIFYTAALLDHWRGQGASVINGAEVLALDSSKARQLSLITRLGFAIPETRVVHRADDLMKASDGMAFPLLVKANIGGAGAGIVRYASRAELAASVADSSVPDSIDKVLLLQDYVPRAAASSLGSRRSRGSFSMRSTSTAAVTVSTCALPTPVSPSPVAPRSECAP